MGSSYFSHREHDAFDARWSGSSGEVLLSVKRSSNARDARDSMLALTYTIDQEPSHVQGLCILTKTRLSEQRLHEELERFRRVVRPSLGQRIFLAGIDDAGEFVGSLPSDASSLRRFIAERIESDSGYARVSRQTVKGYLLDCWLTGLGPQTITSLREATGASHPTVVAALEDLRAIGAVSEDQLQGAVLRDLDWEVWRRLAEAQSANRKIIRFVDPSREARRPSQLARRLSQLQEKGQARMVEIGGVLGAQEHYPELDITAAPRLDLCVYDEDKSFVRGLDAALLETKEPGAKAAVVLHLTPKPRGRHPEMRRGSHAASPLDCLADLLEIGYQAEARDFALALTRRTRRAKAT